MHLEVFLIVAFVSVTHVVSVPKIRNAAIQNAVSLRDTLTDFEDYLERINENLQVATQEDEAEDAKDSKHPHIAAAVRQGHKCQGSLVDLGFLLDSSHSLRASYQKEKNFVKALTAEFGVSKDLSRASVITFSHKPVFSIKFKDHFDIKSFNAAVDAIPYIGYTTRIDRALRMVQAEMFETKNGARVGAPKILVLLTDGAQTKNDKNKDAVDPAIFASELRQSGVTVIVVGIGAETDREELLHMADGIANTFTCKTFDELVSRPFVKKLTTKCCDVAHTLQSVATNGFWGDWGLMQRCPKNQYVYGYRMQSEKRQGWFGDDTGLNAVQLFCGRKGSVGSYTPIQSSTGPFGTFGGRAFCSGSPVDGFEMRMDPKHGLHNDDTAANDVHLYCTNGASISAEAKTDWGKWTASLHCPIGWAVVGIETRVEKSRGVKGDDSALNGVKLLCDEYV